MSKGRLTVEVNMPRWDIADRPLDVPETRVCYNGEPLTPEQIAKLEAVLWCDENGWAVSDQVVSGEVGIRPVGGPITDWFFGKTLAEAVARAREATTGDGA